MLSLEQLKHLKKKLKKAEEDYYCPNPRTAHIPCVRICEHCERIKCVCEGICLCENTDIPERCPNGYR